jgi:hypothetical protein
MMAARKHQFKNPAEDEPAEITGCVKSFEPGARDGVRADSVSWLRVGLHSFDHRIAVHEAGHVIAGYTLLSVAGATIEFVDGHYGRVWSDDAALEPDSESVESICAQLAPLMPGALHSEIEQAHCHCIEFLAGIEAERLFCDELLARTGHDILAARAIAALITREVGDVDAYIEFARAETRALLSTHAGAVLAVAAALVEHRTINRSQIAEIMRNHSDKEFRS